MYLIQLNATINKLSFGINTTEHFSQRGDKQPIENIARIVMNSGSQLSELQSVSQMSQVSRIVLCRNCEHTLPHTIVTAKK